MSAGRIEYAIGLDTASLLGKLGGANQALELLGKAFTALGTIGHQVFGQIERGAALQDLSNRTGETVGNLFQLEYAFKQSGVAAGSVPPTLLKFQKALSGVSELGESTAEAFSALGLSTKEFSQLDSPAALLKVFAGLNGLDRNSATDVASRIFGRGSAGDILQLARDSKDVAENFKVSAEQAALMQRNARAFDAIGDSLGRVKFEVEGIFAKLAEDIAPALNSIGPALQAGRIGELLSAELNYGFAVSVNFFSDSLQRVFASLPHLFAAAVNGLAGFASTLGGGLVKGVGPSLLKAAGPFLPPGMGAGLAAWEKQSGGVSGLFSELGGHFSEIFGQQINQAVDAAFALVPKKLINTDEIKAARDRLRASLLGGGDPADPARSASLGNSRPLASGFDAFAPIRPDTNALQRAGLWGSSGGMGGGDARLSRIGIQAMVGHLESIRRDVANLGGANVELRNR